VFEIKELPSLRFKGFIEKIDLDKRSKGVPEFWGEVTSDEQFAPLYRSMDHYGIVGISYEFTETDSKYLIGIQSESGDVSFEASIYAFFIVKGSLPGSVRRFEPEGIKQIHESGYMFDGVMIEMYPEGDPSRDDYITEVYFKIKRSR